MNKPPRVLVIDDVLGPGPGTRGRNKDRDNFCLRLGLRDITGDYSPIYTVEPFVDAVFYRGQIEENGYVRNDIQGVLSTILEGWKTWPRWSLLLLDLHFATGKIKKSGLIDPNASDMDPQNYFGLRILEEIQKEPSLKDLPIIVLSSMDRSQVEKSISDGGAIGFQAKDELNISKLQDILFHTGLMDDDIIIGRSLSTLKCLREARRRSRLQNENILLLGETGTGKELIAEYIHRQSRRQGDYKILFTNGVSESLIDDRMFGHVKGAFTGADNNQPGVVELADGGTLFIDEFGNIPEGIQDKLLRLLDRNTRQTQRIGSQDIRQVDLLVVMATSRMDVLTNKDFHTDLLYRAKISQPLIVPPLRERAEDIPVLTKYFVDSYVAKLSAEKREISDEAMGILVSYSWPGNVRQLEDEISHAISQYPNLRTLSANHLSTELKNDPTVIIPSIVGKQGDSSSGKTVSMRGDDDVSAITVKGTKETNIAKAMSGLSNLVFDLSHPEEWAGQMQYMLDTFEETVARYLKSALQVTLKADPDSPGGKISIHSALKLMTGDKKLTTSNAADLIKKFQKISLSDIDLWKTDSILHEACETATRLRPKNFNNRKKQTPKQTT